MDSKEKCILLKDTIEQLYCKEGRSKNYISKLLNVNRKVLTDMINNEWNFVAAEPRRHLTASNEKLFKKNREKIRSMLISKIPIKEIANTIGCTEKLLMDGMIKPDVELSRIHQGNLSSVHKFAEQRRQNLMEISDRNYNVVDIEGEVWEPIMGYDGYFVSNMGRIKKYANSYDTYFLIRQTENTYSGRMYVALHGADGGKKNLQVARIVAHAFVGGYDEEHNTVNHNDGNVQNNMASNLTWMSQSDNNKHAYSELDRAVVTGKRYKFRKIVYKDKYEFSTVAAFARFIGMSETQTRRYMDNPEKYDIKLIE